MILTGQQILDLGIIKNAQNKFTREYDLCEGGIITLSGGADYSGYGLTLGQRITLKPREFCLASTAEHITVPNRTVLPVVGHCSVVGFTVNKSTLARIGLWQPNTDMESGWKGHLTLELFNAADKTLYLVEGMPIATARFMPTLGLVEAYAGKYQDQPAKPVEAK